jgi:hypothetical protein
MTIESLKRKRQKKGGRLGGLEGCCYTAQRGAKKSTPPLPPLWPLTGYLGMR